MTKTETAILALVAGSGYLGSPPNDRAKIAANIFNNDLRALVTKDKAKKEEANWSEMWSHREDLPEALDDLVTLRSHDLCSSKHVKMLMPLLWDHPYVPISDHLIDTKMLEETEGDELEKVVRKVIEDNAKTVAIIQAGKRAAIGSLIGQVMKAVKADPVKVKTMLEAMIP